MTDHIDKIADKWLMRYMSGKTPAIRKQQARDLFRCMLRDLWQPIETAPKDGTRILLRVTSYGAVTAFWYHHDWIIADEPARFETPTHWMPLLEPPKSPEENP